MSPISLVFVECALQGEALSDPRVMVCAGELTLAGHRILRLLLESDADAAPIDARLRALAPDAVVVTGPSASRVAPSLAPATASTRVVVEPPRGMLLHPESLLAVLAATAAREVAPLPSSAELVRDLDARLARAPAAWFAREPERMGAPADRPTGLLLDALPCWHRAPSLRPAAALAPCEACASARGPGGIPHLGPDRLESQARAQTELCGAVARFTLVGRDDVHAIEGAVQGLASLRWAGAELRATLSAQALLHAEERLDALLARIVERQQRLRLSLFLRAFSSPGENGSRAADPSMLVGVGALRMLARLTAAWPQTLSFEGRDLDIEPPRAGSPWSRLAEAAYVGHALGLSRLAPVFFLGTPSDASPEGATLEDEDAARALEWTRRLLSPATPHDEEWAQRIRVRMGDFIAEGDHPLRIHAAALKAARVKPALADAAMAPRILREVLRPSAELFSWPMSEEPPTGGPPPTAVANAVELELELLLEGEKAAAKLELASRPETDRCKERLAEAGYHFVWRESVGTLNLQRPSRTGEPTTTFVVIAGRSARDVDAFVIAQDAGESDEEATRERGRLLGYPSCCAEAFSRIPLWAVQSDAHLLGNAVFHTTGPVDAALDPLAPDRLLEYFPCSLDCEASRARVSRLLRARHLRGQPSPPPPPAAYLVLGVGARLEFEDVKPWRQGWQYGSVRLVGECAIGPELCARLQRADALEAAPGLLLLHRHGKLVDLAPHPFAVPIVHGTPNRFPWLAASLAQLASNRAAGGRAEPENRPS